MFKIDYAVVLIEIIMLFLILMSEIWVNVKINHRQNFKNILNFRAKFLSQIE